jgi:DNA-binding transcriptional MerR regulator
LNKAPDAFRTISEVADELDLPQHVLRFWESRFAHIKPLKRGGGRRYYRPEDIDLLRGIRRLLYADGYTIRGVQRILREQGVRTVQLVGQGHEVPTLLRDGEDGSSSNGTRPDVNFLMPPGPLDDTEDDGGGPEAAVRPQNGPTADVNVAMIRPAAVAPVARREAGAVGQAPAAVVPVTATLDAATPAVVTPPAAIPAAAPPAAVTSAAVAPAGLAPAGVTPVAASKPSPPNMAARDLERLKQALAELEACRRLLDKAIEGGR